MRKRVEGPVQAEGELDGAQFRIDIPGGWNGGLVMYAHGYTVAGTEPKYNDMLVTVANELGLAVAQSKYSRQGWAAEEGTLETEALRKYFVKQYGKTEPTIIAGHSQGAAITFKTIEKYAKAYDGALPMCGTPEPSLQFMKARIFDMRLLFDYYFPGLPGSVVEFPEDSPNMPGTFMKVQALIKDRPEEAKAFADLVELPGPDSLPSVIAFWTEILRELQTRAGGNAFDNRDSIYIGSDDDAALNREIPRYAADEAAVAYLREWVTNTGRIEDPVLSMHTLVDQLIPADRPDFYKQLTQIVGTQDLYSQLYVASDGHCNFTEAQTKEALELLLKWIQEGERPGVIDLTEVK